MRVSPSRTSQALGGIWVGLEPGSGPCPWCGPSLRATPLRHGGPLEVSPRRRLRADPLSKSALGGSPWFFFERFGEQRRQRYRVSRRVGNHRALDAPVQVDRWRSGSARTPSGSRGPARWRRQCAAARERPGDVRSSARFSAGWCRCAADVERSRALMGGIHDHSCPSTHNEFAVALADRMVMAATTADASARSAQIRMATS